MKNIFNLILAAILLIFTSSFAKQRTITGEDLYLIKQISDCRVSPNGKTIAYVLEKIDRENNRYISNIRLISVKGGTSKQLTSSPARDVSPRWSPDSRYIAFVSNRSGTNQIWIIAVDGGEAWALTNIPTGAYSPAWAPDGSAIAFLSRTAEKKNIRTDKNLRSINNNGKEYATDVRIVRNLKYRYQTKYFDGKYSHIFTIPINGGKVKQLTYGNYHDSSPAWSPNNKLIAFASNRHGDLHYDDNSDIYTISSTGGQPKQLTKDPGPEREPLWSPDGKYICYIGKTEANNYALQNNLWTINVTTKKTANITNLFDRNIYKAQWSTDAKKIHFLASDQGNINLYSTSITKKTYKKILTGKRQIQFYSMSSKKNIAFIATKNTNPSDLYVSDLSGKHERKLTHINKKLLSELCLSEPEEIFFTSSDSTQIHGWIMKPIQFSADKKYPMILEIHGGPHWYYGNRWFQEFQILAAQGYVVFYCNPRLSTAYGQKFSMLGTAQWGKGDYEDIMAGVNYVIKSGYIDTTKMGITGGSYGGFMTNWIIGHTNRFKAAVTQRSLSNLVSFYGTTDIQSFVEFEFGSPVEDFKKLYDFSPINYAKNMNTPLLILHSELDFRVPICQAEELFTILKRKNIDVEFVRYPNEGHDLSRSGQPVHRVDRYNRIVDWFDKYLGVTHK